MQDYFDGNPEPPPFAAQTFMQQMWKNAPAGGAPLPGTAGLARGLAKNVRRARQVRFTVPIRRHDPPCTAREHEPKAKNNSTKTNAAAAVGYEPELWRMADAESRSKDILGRVYEYFLAQLRSAECYCPAGSRSSITESAGPAYEESKALDRVRMACAIKHLVSVKQLALRLPFLKERPRKEHNWSRSCSPIY